jgi:hypothetical protein
MDQQDERNDSEAQGPEEFPGDGSGGARLTIRRIRGRPEHERYDPNDKLLSEDAPRVGARVRIDEDEFIVLEVVTEEAGYQVRLRPVTDVWVPWSDEIDVVKEADLSSNSLFRVDERTARIV